MYQFHRNNLKDIQIQHYTTCAPLLCLIVITVIETGVLVLSTCIL